MAIRSPPLVETLSPRPGSSALVFGAGPTGLLLSQLIARGGAVSVTVAASSAFKLKRAETLGIDTTFLMDRADLAGDAAKLKAESAAVTTSSSTPPGRRPCRNNACR